MGFLRNIFGNDKEKKLFQYLNEAAHYGFEASTFFFKLCCGDDAKECAGNIRLIEHNCDQAIAEIFHILDTTSMLPFNHSDIAELAGKLDDVVDLIWGAADRIVYRYDLSEFCREPELKKLAVILHRMMETVNDVIPNLKNLKKFKALSGVIKSFHAQENEADDLREEAVKRWHELSIKNPADLPLRIAWAEVYDRLEWATNRCVDITDVIGSFFRKYS